MNLVHCVYCSVSTKKDLTVAELESLLEECRQNNGKADITGMLLYKDGSFFQVLEGDRDVIDALFDKIALDKRHRHTTKIIYEPIAERTFAAWTMGYPRISLKELAEIPGLNDFFTRGSSYRELGEGRAKTLIAAFKEGRWRLLLT